ncbi:MAG: guanylate kinase [Ruminococcaceae bacterium]|nr:guanylate kinase [Oscillospiraceae bacterium]MBQ3215340.1 guanylate kinase [Oscillospiraceae bacterium]
MSGKLFVISGASGVGKGTVLAGVMEKRKDLAFSVSATTRPPRPSETEGVHYYFVTDETFQEMIRQDEFLEYDLHANACYGTPKGQLEEKLANYHVILDVEPAGAEIVHKKRPDATLIFIMPPSLEELERRLRGRGDTSEEQIALRLKRAKWEMDQKDWYDYVVVNDRLEDCIEEVLNIIAQKADE